VVKFRHGAQFEVGKLHEGERELLKALWTTDVRLEVEVSIF
jgi:hypothetical protein